MAAVPPRPRVFLDVAVGEESAVRLVVELFVDKAPKTCENFRVLCIGAKPPLTYKDAPFHRIIDDFMVQGGDITRGDGTGGVSIYGDEFEDENLGWRDVDEEGLLCMANRGKDTNGSQFFITLAACPHLNNKHTVFGCLVSGQDAVRRLATVATDKDDRPSVPVRVTHCGELERRTKRPTPAQRNLEREDTRTDEDLEDRRGRRKRRRSEASIEKPTQYETGDDSHQRQKDHRHRHHRDRSRDQEESHHDDGLAPPPDTKRRRRRSNSSLDGNLRGRSRRRSRSRSTSAYDARDTRDRRPQHNDEAKNGGGWSRSRSPERHDEHRHHHHRRHRRSPEPSRPGRDPSPEDAEYAEAPYVRRRRSLPNQYREWERHHEARWRDDDHSRGSRLHDEGEEERLRWEEWAREGGEERYRDARDESGRLGGGGGWHDDERGADDGDGVVYKGRGSMKYRERRKW